METSKYALDNYYENLNNDNSIEDAQNLALQTQGIKQQNRQIAENSAIMSGTKSELEHLANKTYDAFTMGLLEPTTTDFDPMGRVKTSGSADILVSVLQAPFGGFIAKAGMKARSLINPLLSKYTSQNIMSGHIIPSLSKEGKKYKSKASYIFENPIKSTVGFVGSNALLSAGQQVSQMTDKGIETHRVGFWDSKHGRVNDEFLTSFILNMAISAPLAGGFLAVDSATKSKQYESIMKNIQNVKYAVGLKNEEHMKAVQDAFINDTKSIHEEEPTVDSTKGLTDAEREALKAEQEAIQIEEGINKELGLESDSQRKDGFTGLKSGEHEKSYDFYNENTGEIHRDVKLLGAYKKYSKNGLSRDDYIVAQKLTKELPNVSDFEKISDGVKLANENQKKKLQSQIDEFIKLKNDYNNKKINDKEYAKKLQESIKNIKDNIYKLEQDNFGSKYKKIRTRLKVKEPKTNAEHEWIRTNKKELDNFKKLRKQKIKDLFEKSLTNKDIKKIMEDDNVVKDFLEGLSVKDRKSILKSLKDKNKRKDIIKHIEEYIDDIYRPVNGAKLGSTVNPALFDLKIDGERILKPSYDAHAEHFLDGDELYKEKSMLEHLKAYALIASKVFNDNDLKGKSKEEIRQMIISEINKPDEETFNYHAPEVIDITNGLTAGTTLNKNADTDFDLTKDEKIRVNELIKQADEALNLIGINKNERVTFKEDISIEKRNKLSFFNAIAELGNYLYNAVEPTSGFARKILNVQNNLLERINTIYKISGMKELEPKDVKENFNSFVAKLQDRYKNIQKEKSDSITILNHFFKKDENNNIVIKKEAEALLYQAYVKTLSESLTKSSIRVVHDQKTGDISFNIKFNTENFDPTQLGSKIIKKMIIDSGVNKKEHPLLIDNVRNEIKSMFEGIETGFEKHINQLNDGMSIDITKNIKANPDIINRIKGTFGKTKENKIPVLDINKFTQTLHDFKSQKVEILFNGKNVFDEVNGLLSLLNKLSATNDKYELTYRQDHIGSSQDLDPNTPNPIKNKLVEHLENQKAGSLDEVIRKRILISKSKAVLNPSENSLILAMARASIESFKNDELHQQSINLTKQHFDNITSYLSKEKPTKDEAIKAIESLEYLKLYDDGFDIASKDGYSALKEYITNINTDENLKHYINEKSKELFLNEQSLTEHFNLALELKDQFDSYHNYIMNENLEGLYAKINNTYSGRIMYDGDLQYHTNKFAKLFLKFDNYQSLKKVAENKGYKSGLFKDNKEANDYIVSSIKTMVDEIDGLDLVSKDLQNKFKIKGDKPKIEKSPNKNIKNYLQVVKEIIENKIDEKGNLVINNYKEATYLPKLKYVYDHFFIKKEGFETFDPTQVIAEFDGNQNMIGVMNSILGIKDDATGINGKIFNADSDVYMEFLKVTENAVANSGSSFLKQLMQEVEFGRSDIKRPSQAFNYGQSIRNTLNGFLHDMIIKDYMQTKTEAKGNIKSALIDRLHSKYATEDNMVELFGNSYNIGQLKASVVKEVNDYISKLKKFKNIELTKDFSSFDNDTISMFLAYYENIVKKNQSITNPELSNTYNTIRENIIELAKKNNINLTSVDNISELSSRLAKEDINALRTSLRESLDYDSTKRILHSIQSDMYKVDNTEILLMKIKSSLQDKEQQLFSNYNTIIDMFVDKTFLESIKELNKRLAIEEKTISHIKDNKSSKVTEINSEKYTLSLFSISSIENNLFNKYNNENFINELANVFLENTNIVSSFKNQIDNNPQFKKVEEFKNVTETLYTLNVIKNVNQLQSVAINKDTIINETSNELGLSDEEKKLVFEEVNKNQTPTYIDIADAFQIAVSKNVFGSKNFIKLSGVKHIKTPFGRKILPFTIKGTGYKDGLSFQSISAINKGLTYFIQSTESNALSLGSHLALKEGEIHSLIHRFDAQYGLQGMRVAKHQNDIYNALYADTHFLEYMKQDMIETYANLSQQLNETSGGGSLKESIKEVAKQMIISDAGEIKSEEQLNSKVNELENLLKYGYMKNIDEKDNIKVKTKEEHIINKVDRLLKDKKEALKDIKDSDKITNQQFSNGIIESSMTKKEALNKMNDLRKIDEGKSKLSVDEPTLEHNALHKDELQNIDISMMNEAYNGMSSFFGSDFIKYFKLDYNFLNFEHNAFGSKLLKDKLQVISTKGKSKVEVDNATGQIKLYLKQGISNTKDVYKIVHELTHMLLHTSKDNELVKQVRTSLTQIAKDLKVVNKGIDFGITIKGEVVTLEKYLQFNEAKTLPDGIKTEHIQEFESMFFHTLLGNDLIKSNKKLLAYISKGKKDVNAKVSINGDIQGIQLYKDGKLVQDVTTIKQFNEILKKANINNDLKGIKNTALSIYGLLNTDHKLKSHILKESVSDDSFGAMFKEIQERVDYVDTLVSKANDKFFSKVGLYELLDISNDRLALNQAMNLYNGAEKQLIKQAHKSREIYENKIKEIEPTEYEKLDQALGLATTFGLHILNSDVVKTPLTNRLGSLLNEINTDFFTSIKVTSEGTAKSFYKKLEDHYQKRILNEIENKFGVDVRNAVDKLSKEVAFGNEGSVKKLSKYIKDNMYSDMTDKNARTLAKKLGSVNMLLSKRGFKDGENHYTKQLNYVFEHMKEPTHRDTINEIFYNFEQNSNKYTTFGENVDLQFLKDSKTLYLSEDANLGDNHKVATIYDNGKKYYIYTKYVYDTRLGSQEHQLMSFNLDEFEKGIFRREYEVNGEKVFVSINPQNMKLKNELFNTHISVQAQKNTYTNQKVKIGRDILYRQFKLLRENGVLLTKKEVDERMKNFDENKEVYKQLSKDNPLSQVFGTEFYINKSVSHYLEGTTGIHLEKALNNIMSEKTSKAVALTIKTMSDLTKQISSTILGVLPKFWFTSWLASYTVFGMHADNGFVTYGKYHKKAQKALRIAKKHMELKIDALNKKSKLEYQLHKEPNNDTIKKQLDKINQDIETYDKNLKNLGVLEAFEYGIGSTMKLDLLEMDSKKELNMFNMLKNSFGKDSNAYHFAKVLSFDPKHNRWGKFGYDMFEASELVPKLALYYEKIEKGYKPSESANYVSMAYPRYNNLNGVASIAGEFVPYTKFMLEFPRMIAMMSLASPKKYLATALMMNYLTAFGYGASMQDGSDTWEERHNIFMMNEEFGLNLNSMVSNFEAPMPFIQSPLGVYDWGLSVFTDPTNNILPLAYFK